MCNQRLHIDFSVGEQPQEFLEVALLSPAHVADRQINALKLVKWIQGSRACSLGDDELDLLEPEFVAIRMDISRAHDHNPAALAAKLNGLVDRAAVLTGGGDDDGIGALPGSDRFADARESVAVGRDVVKAEPPGERDLVGCRVERDDVAAIGTQHLDRQEPKQAQAHDHHARAECQLGTADAMQRDDAKHPERGVLVRDVVWNPGRQVDGDRDELRVRCKSLAHAGHAIPGREFSRGRTALLDDACAAIAQRRGRIEAAHGLVPSLEQPLFACLFPGAAHQIRPRRGLADQGLAPEFDRRTLGAKADQRIAVAHQDALAAALGDGDIAQRDLPGLVALDDLLHPRAGPCRST